MTCAHVRLLGPCFKTGLIDYRPTRHRPQPVNSRAEATLRTHSSRLALRAVPAIRQHERRATYPTRALVDPRSPNPPTPPGSIKLRLAVQPPYPRASGGRRTGRGALPAESALQSARTRAGPVPKDQAPTRSRTSTGEFRGSTMRLHQFTSMQFHVLLNSLFKVLFNFPSQYLFAIGLMPVFSLRWSLPPTLGCNLKQPDSGEAQRDDGR